MQAWGRTVAKSIPLATVKTLIAPMQKKFLRKMAVKGSVSIVGRALPFGIGAAVGGAGNYMMGRAVVASANRAFGPAPLMIPEQLLAELETNGKAAKPPKEPKALKPPKPAKVAKQAKQPRTHKRS